MTGRQRVVTQRMKKREKTIDGQDYAVYGVNADLIDWIGDSALAQAALGPAGADKLIDKLFLAFDSQTDAARVRHSKDIIRDLWNAHAALGPYPFLDVLSEFEFDRRFYANYRDHVCHQLKVYLLGLFAYDRVAPLRAALDEAFATGGAEQFAARWLVTAVYHDLGYVLENEAALRHDSEEWRNTREALNEALRAPLSHVRAFAPKFSIAAEQDLIRRHRIYTHSIGNDPVALETYAGADLFEELREEAERAGLRPTKGKAPLRVYWEYAFSHAPAGRPRFYDHGIASALLLLQGWRGFKDHVNEVLANAAADPLVQANRPALDRLVADLDAHRETVRAAAAAMALHNIYPTDWDPASVLEHGLDLQGFEINLTSASRKTPLAFLLGLIDTLQDWDRPRFRPERPDERALLTDQDISITSDGERLILEFRADADIRDPAARPDSLYARAIRALKAYLEPAAIDRLVDRRLPVSTLAGVALSLTPSSVPAAAGPMVITFGTNPFQGAGTMPPRLPSYIYRPCDEDAKRHLQQPGFLSIEGSFRAGKSSLLVRCPDYLDGHLGVAFRSCYVDLGGVAVEAETFDRSLRARLGRELRPEKPRRALDDWDELLAMAEVQPLVILFDEFSSLSSNEDVMAALLTRLQWLRERAGDRLRVALAQFRPIGEVLAECGLLHEKFTAAWASTTTPDTLTAPEMATLVGLLPPTAAEAALGLLPEIVERSGARHWKAQRLCARLHEAVARGPITREAVERLIHSDASYQ